MSYGCDPRADLVLGECGSGKVVADFAGETLELVLAARGKHMALNALAVWGAAHLAGIDFGLLRQKVATFTPEAGRGRVVTARFNGAALTVVDESYNANPLSMKMALEALADSSAPVRSRVVFLADMLELGADAEEYHRELLPVLLRAAPDRVVLCGPLMRSLWRELEPQLARQGWRGSWLPTVEELIAELGEWVQEGDLVLVKGSYSTRLRTIVKLLTQGDQL